MIGLLHCVHCTSHNNVGLILQGGMCTLYIASEDKVVSVASEHLEPVRPQKGDKVSIINGYLLWNR